MALTFVVYDQIAELSEERLQTYFDAHPLLANKTYTDIEEITMSVGPGDSLFHTGIINIIHPDLQVEDLYLIFVLDNPEHTFQTLNEGTDILNNPTATAITGISGAWASTFTDLTVIDYMLSPNGVVYHLDGGAALIAEVMGSPRLITKPLNEEPDE